MSSVGPANVATLFAQERANGIPIAALSRNEVSYTPLSQTEADTVNLVFDSIVNHFNKVAPSIAADIAAQRSLALKMAGIAKATFPTLKNYQFPAVPGSLGVAPLFPEAIKYAATPSSSAPAYTSYNNDSWTINLTAGQAAYLFGAPGQFYLSSPTTNAHSFIVVFNNGIIEEGTTPKVQQFQLISAGQQNYGPYTVEPLVDVTVERDKTLYQYPTPLGALWIDYQTGVSWSMMPTVTGVSTIKLIGLVFYEYDFFANLTYV